MRSLTLLFVLCFAVAVSATHVLYTRQAPPSGWKRAEVALPHDAVEFTIALKQRNLDILNKWFEEASDPTHHNYQSFKTIDEINDLVSPVKADKQKVVDWLVKNGVHHHQIKDFGDALDVKTTVKHAAPLFSTKFYNYQHEETGATVVRQFGDYSIPKELKGLVEIVTGISTFPIPHLNVIRTNSSADGVSNDYGVAPQTLAQVYNIPPQASQKKLRAKLNPQAAAFQTSQAVIEFSAQNYAPSDLAQYSTDTSIPITPLPASQIIGPNDPTQPGDESTLDIELIAAVNPVASNWFWLEQGNGWLYQFCVHFFSTQNVPLVNSISYGWWEGDQCNAQIAGSECSSLGVDTVGYVERVNTEFQKIGLRGISLIVASGDSGANGRTNGDCSIPQLRAAFPSSSPYVTSVGATEMVNTTPLNNPPAICANAGLQCAGTGTEQAVSYGLSQFTSGGGFSSIAARPSYQAAAVNAYLNSGVALPPSSYFNASGRGAPDIAAAGHNLLITLSGSDQAVGGTSAATPIVAAIMTMLNAESIQQSGKPLGFLSPLLYQMHAADASLFNDITVGDNKCTENGCAASCQGYMAAPGWDPVTGLGTPNAGKMLQYIKTGQHTANKRK